jgi:hypothetical protein
MSTEKTDDETGDSCSGINKYIFILDDKKTDIR